MLVEMLNDAIHMSIGRFGRCLLNLPLVFVWDGSRTMGSLCRTYGTQLVALGFPSVACAAT